MWLPTWGWCEGQAWWKRRAILLEALGLSGKRRRTDREQAVTEMAAGQSYTTLRERQGQGEGLCVPGICF